MTPRALSSRAQPLTLHERREALEAAISVAIDTLDALDGDADLEPSHGSVSVQPWDDQRRWSQGARDDREEACEDEGAQVDTGSLDPDEDPCELVTRCEAGLF